MKIFVTGGWLDLSKLEGKRKEVFLKKYPQYKDKLNVSSESESGESKASPKSKRKRQGT